MGSPSRKSIVRGLFGDEYLKKLHPSIRPYEVNPGETDQVFEACREDLYASFRKRESFFKTLRNSTERLVAVKTRNGDSRPKILVTGEYVVRTDQSLNQHIHRKIEMMGGEAVRTPLFADYVEIILRQRYRSLWKLGRRSKSVRDFFLTRFSLNDVKRIKALFRQFIPDQIEPNPVPFLEEISAEIRSELDPVMLLEFYQAYWNMERGGIAGIVNVHPFGCSISGAVEPLLHRNYAHKVPFISLSFDGQSGVHQDNRLAAFMECVQERSYCSRLTDSHMTFGEKLIEESQSFNAIYQSQNL